MYIRMLVTSQWSGVCDILIHDRYSIYFQRSWKEISFIFFNGITCTRTAVDLLVKYKFHLKSDGMMMSIFDRKL